MVSRFLDQIADQRFTVLSVTVIVAAAAAIHLYWKGRDKSAKKRVKSKIMSPEELQNAKWECVGKISQLWIYPVKSCAAVALKTAFPSPEGLTDGKIRDRAFAFTTEKGNLIRGSMIGATVLITPVLTDTTLTLKHADMEDLIVNLEEVESKKKEATINIFGDIAPGYDCGDAAANWLEKVFKKKGRLLYHSNIPSPRKTEDQVGKYPLMRGNDNALYADGFPYMLMTKESIADLQSRVSCPTPPQNFRPNILVEGTSKAFDEDDWAYIRIGEAIFRNLSPCTRCTFTTVNYKTGIKEANNEPLRTLKGYRTLEKDESPFFGVNLGLEIAGTMKDDDNVYVTRFSQM